MAKSPEEKVARSRNGTPKHHPPPGHWSLHKFKGQERHRPPREGEVGSCDLYRDRCPLGWYQWSPVSKPNLSSLTHTAHKKTSLPAVGSEVFCRRLEVTPTGLEPVSPP